MLARALLLATFAFAAAAAGAPTAEAAIRQCKSRIVSEGRHPNQEIEARKAALAQWVQAATRHGEGYARWGIAIDRAINCNKEPAGGFRCRAVGAPCTVVQAPPADAIPVPLPKRSKPNSDA